MPPGYSWSLALLVAARFTLGVGEAVIFPASNRFVGHETAPMRKDRVIPISLGESKSFAAGADTPMELLVVGVARDAAAKRSFTLTAPRFGGPPAPPGPAPAR